MKIIFISLAILLSTHLAYTEGSKIEEVVDAVTFKLTNGKMVRLMGVQMPEDEQMRQKATECVKMLNIEGKEVRLELDAQGNDTLLAYVYVQNTAHYDPDSPEQTWLPPQAPDPRIWNIADTWEMFLNAYIIQRGYALPTADSQNTPYADLFEGLYQEAKANKRGLWEKDL